MTTTLTGTSTVPKRIFNFSAGPSVLPEEVLRQAQEDLWSIRGSGIGVLEHSHRGKVFTQVMEEAEADCRKVAGIGDEYAVMFLQGGATMQFAMIPMSFLGEGKTADYLHTGVWTKKAIKDAKLFGNVHLAFDGTSCSFDHVPAPNEISATADAAYAWYCSNNTIYGTEYQDVPKCPAPLVCDASSDIFSRPIDVAGHAAIIAGAQKNLGPAGATLVIMRKDFMERARAELPQMMDYRRHAEQGSCLNTPPCFSIYVMGQVFKWILKQGGLEAVAERNRAKAGIVYDAIDGSGGFYRAVARTDSRSLMNITFRTPSEDADAKFVAEALDNEMSGLKGHRDVGGLRASVYNAFPTAGCTALAEFMKDFASRNG